MGDSNTWKSKLSWSTGVKRPIGSISSCESLDLRTVSTNEAMQWVLGRVQNPKIQNALLQCLGRHPYHKDCTSLIQKIVDIGTSHLHWCEKQTRFQGYLASLLRDDIASTELVFRIATQYNVSQDDIVSLAEKSTFTSNTTSDDYLRIRREKKQKTPTPDQLYPSVKFHNLWKAWFYTEAIYFLREASYEYFKDDQIRMITKLLESYSDTRIRNIPRTLIESYLSDLLIATNSISLLSAVIISSYKSLGHPNGRYALLANTRVLILLDHCAPSEQSEALEQLRKCLLVRWHISGLKRIVDIYYPVYQEHGGTVSRNELEQYANAKLQSFHIKNEHQSMLIHEMIDHYEKYHSDMSGYVKKRSMHDIKHTYELFF